MAADKKIDWHLVITKVLKELPVSQEVSLDDLNFRFRYIVDPESRIGYLLVWEKISKRCVQVSRVRAKDNFPIISLYDPDEFAREVPIDLIIEDIGG